MIGAPRLFLPAALATLLALRAAAAQTGDDPPADAAPRADVVTIEVRAEEEGAGSALDPTAFATVIRAEEFADRVTSVEELLRETVGVQVRSLGGEFATVSIRGSSAEQVVVYLDGVPLNRSLGGGVNLADLPLAQVESIAIYRGFTPAALPAASIGGAVVITTRRGEGRTRDAAGRPGAAAVFGAAAISGGSFGTAEGALALSGRHGGSDWAVGFDLGRSRGDFDFLDNNSTPFDDGDDEIVPRTNNEFERGHLSGQYSVAVGSRGRFAVTTDLFERRQGVPGLDALQSRQARFATRRLLLRPAFEVPGLLGGRVLLRGAADYTRQEDLLDDRAGELGSPRLTDHVIESLGQEVGLTVVATARQAVSILAARRSETAALRDAGPEPRDLGTATRDTITVTVEDQIALASGRLVLNPALRHERFDSAFRAGPGDGLVPAPADGPSSETTGKAGFRLRLGEGLTFMGNFGRFLRLPSMSELFGDRGTVLGSPALEPERGRSLDLGLVVERRRPGAALRSARLEGTLFETLADNLILIVPTAQTKVVAENSGRARVRGAEMSLALAIGARFTGSLNATHQRAIDMSGGYADGRDLPGRPADEVSAAAALAIGRGRLLYTFTYVGANFVDRPNTESQALPARYLHDAGYRLRLPRGLNAVVEVKNLLDRRTVDVARYPLPGRSVHARLSWAF